MTGDLETLKQALLTHSTPEAAKKMSAYMLNQFEFLGINTPLRRQLSQAFIKNAASEPVEIILKLVNELWQFPQREMQYIAIDLMQQSYKKLTISDVPEIINLAVQKSWWDSVDGLAAVCNKILRLANKIEYTQLLQEAIASENLWVRRIAILHQLGWKQQTDTTLLYSFALQNAIEKDFFIRKAIGWSLRDYAKYDSANVYAFIDSNKPLFSGLTYREATKHRILT